MAHIGWLIAVCFVLAMAPVRAQQSAVGTTMSVAAAHASALAGDIVFVDVRTPDEWKESGVPSSAYAITMHQDPAAFLAALQSAVGGDRTRRLAIICRSGNRTSAIYGDLQKAGFTNLINVAEGVAGGPNGRGWLKAGLPVRAPNQSRAVAPVTAKP